LGLHCHALRPAVGFQPQVSGEKNLTVTEIGIYAAALGLIAVFFWFVFHLVPAKHSPAAANPEPAVSPGKRIPCILCGAVLARGEKLHSKEIVRDNDSIIHMYGCAYCHGRDSTRSKTCPVCKKAMGRDEYLIGRMWKRKNGKKHLHISGCIRCAGKV
jgi:predicted nucleic acid-binding Zn ribbon protein